MKKKEIILEIEEIVEELYEIGDQDEASSKNFANGFCSIYYYNDLNHLIDYGSNGHRKRDTVKFKKLWNELLDLVKHLKPTKRKAIIYDFIDKNILFYFKDYQYDIDYNTPRHYKTLA